MGQPKAIIAGAGIGGLAAALACARAGWRVELLEQTGQFAHVGAGIQVGPNVTRILNSWGLEHAFAQVAAFPDRLRVRDVVSGRELGSLRLGETALRRYGAPYATIHRADMHAVLLHAVTANPDISLRLGCGLDLFRQDDAGVRVTLQDGAHLAADLLVGADGLWSRVRQQLLADGQPQATGHVAYRTLLTQADLPPHLRSHSVTAWLGTRQHAVHYPVSGGRQLNLVVVVHEPLDRALDMTQWDHGAQAHAVQKALGNAHADLQDLVHRVPQWRLWGLNGRPFMRGADEQARGRVALLGDAAHPMLPYLAQGACMAIEDAECLQANLSGTIDPNALPQRLHRYAQTRWPRNARVQARSARNGRIFHAAGVTALARNLAMRTLGETLLDVPWLYAGP